MTLAEMRACETLADLRRRARERAGDPPDPADFKGRPIGYYLKALGVPENTSRYAREKGVTKLVFLPRHGRRTGEEDGRAEER